MRRLLTLALLALLGLAVTARAGECLGCKTRCTEAPASDCRERGCPCDKRINLAIFDKADKYIKVLADCDAACCARIKAAKSLGNRLKADVCADKGVLDALLNALFYDSCWKVRRAAAWSLFGQRAYQDDVILALYISAAVDPHVLVRSRSAEALDLLTLCHKCCYKELYAQADLIIKDMRTQGFVPGRAGSRELRGGVRPEQSPAGLEFTPRPPGFGETEPGSVPGPSPRGRVMPPADIELIPHPPGMGGTPPRR